MKKNQFKHVLSVLFGLALVVAIVLFFPKIKDAGQAYINKAFNKDPQLVASASEHAGKKSVTKPELSQYYKAPLAPGTRSNTEEGSVKHGAILVLGSRDFAKRPTEAHIQLSDAQEPGQNGETRAERLTTRPKGWNNHKRNGNWVYDRSHLVGYQFSGLNDEPRNLFTGTAYLNRGVEMKGTDAKNPNAMLYYEQELDNWLRLHPNYKLDYYVRLVYEGNENIPRFVYMQWVGIDQSGQTIEIKIGGNSQSVGENANAVLLENASPSFSVDYNTGETY